MKINKVMFWKRAGLGIALVLVAFLSAVIITSPLSQAPFRLHATTSTIGIQLISDLSITLKVAQWEILPTKVAIDGIVIKEKINSLSRNNDDTQQVSGKDIIRIWLNPNDELLIKKLTGHPTTYSLTLPTKPADLRIQLNPETKLRLNEGETNFSHQISGIEASIGGTRQPVLNFQLASEGDELSQRFTISKIGFGALAEDNVKAGLLEGGLYFLDKPESELSLYKGTDLRFGEVDAEISALLLNNKGIEVYASGLTKEAKLFIPIKNKNERQRSVMPTRYDWLKGEPVISIFLGFIAVIVGFLGLVFSAAQAFPPFKKWLSNTLKG